MTEQREFQIAKSAVLGFPLDLAGILVLIGFTAIVAQIVLMRELVVVFCGNEISLGLMLANWLLWTAVGSSLLGRLAARIGNSRYLMAGLQVLVSVSMALTVYAVRASKALIQTLPGELLGPGSMYLTSLVTLSVFCLLSGCMFAAGSRLCADELSSAMASATSTVYLLEAIGSGLGGFAASLVLIERLGSFQIMLVLGMCNLLAAARLAVPASAIRRALMALIAAVFGFLLLPLAAPRMERSSRAALWKGFRLVDVRDTRYGNLAIVDTEGTRSLYQNGLVVATAPGPEAAEEAVHFALLEHPAPKTLLLIGGGVSGSLRQALQHPSLERVEYVELDPTILELAEQYFAAEWSSARADPRVHVHHLDGRLFLKTTPSKFDVIIVNLPDPQTAQLNRFYTVEFFRDARRKLNDDGVFSFQVTASENYISPELADFLRCLHKTLREVFPEVTVIPGGNVHFFASARPGTLASGPEVLIERLRARKLRTSYVREYFLPFRMSADRMLDLKQQIEPARDTPLNRDFAPIAYYFDVALWSARFHPGSRRWFRTLADVGFGPLAGSFLAALAVFIIIFLAWTRWRSRGVRSSEAATRRTGAAGFCVAAMGFTLIGLEILLLLGFQAIYGYVYGRLAVVVAAFMAGIALGAWLATTRPSRAIAREAHYLRDSSLLPALRTVALLQFTAVLAPILLYALLRAFAGVENEFSIIWVSQVVFPLMALTCGLIGGYQFPLASRVYLAEEPTGSAGVLYGLDLLGACVGAVLLSIYLFPVYGFLRSAVLMALANLAPAVLAAVAAAQREAASN